MTKIQSPEIAQASGTGFVPGASREQHVLRSTPNYLGAMSSFTEKLLKPMQENAFMEGMTDSIAGQIEDRSWLTKYSYMQGVGYANFGNKLQEAPSIIQAQAEESLASGEDVKEFNKRTQSVLRDLNSELDNMGLTGEGRLKAQQQIVALQTQALVTYQKEAEAQTKLRIQKGNVSTANATREAISADSTTPLSLAIQLDTMIDNIATTNRKVSPDSIGLASKLGTEVLSTEMNKLNMANPQDRKRFNMLSTYLSTDGAAERITPEDMSKLTNLVVSKTKEAQQVQHDELMDSVRNIELGVANGQSFDTSTYQSTIADVTAGVTTGLINSSDGNTLKNKLTSMYIENNKMNNKSSFFTGTPAERGAVGLSDDAAVVEAKKVFGTQFAGNPVKVMNALIDTGLSSRNPAMAKEGFNLSWKHIEPFMAMKPDDIPKNMRNEDAMVWQQYIMGLRSDPDAAQYAAGAISDPITRKALLNYVENNPSAGANAVQDLQQIQQNKVRLERVAVEGRVSPPEEARITVDKLKRTFGSWIPFTDKSVSPLEASPFHQPSDNILQMKAQMFNTELNNNYATMVVDGKIPASSIEAAQELVGMQRIFVHENGPIRWSPEFANLLRTKDGTKLNTDAIKDSLSNVQKTISKFAKVDKDNIYMEVIGDRLLARAYKDGAPVYTKYIAADELANEASNIQRSMYNKAQEKSKSKVQGVMPTKGGNFYITDGWNHTGLGVIGTKVASMISQHEGYVSDWTNTRSKAEQQNKNLTQTEVIGIGISKKHHPEWAAKLDAVKNDPVAMGKVTADFAKQYFQNFPRELAANGLNTYNKPEYELTNIMLADARWHGGKAGLDGYAKALRMPDVNSALNALKNLEVYKQAGEKSLRAKRMEQGVQQYFTFTQRKFNGMFLSTVKSEY